MATAAEPKLLTAEEFMAADLGDGNYELVRGEIVEMPRPTPEHGRVCMNAGFALELFGRQTGLGYAITNDSAVLTERDPDTVRGPDVCFYTHARWPRSQLGKGLPPVPPDVAVEVYSPGNRRGKMNKKIWEYLEIGVLLVWVVYPETRTVAIHRMDDQPPLILREDAVIENLPELPGFRCPVSDFFV
jgi:Uma2 family endonuclease